MVGLACCGKRAWKDGSASAVQRQPEGEGTIVTVYPVLVCSRGPAQCARQCPSGWPWPPLKRRHVNDLPVSLLPVTLLPVCVELSSFQLLRNCTLLPATRALPGSAQYQPPKEAADPRTCIRCSSPPDGPREGRRLEGAAMARRLDGQLTSPNWGPLGAMCQKGAGAVATRDFPVLGAWGVGREVSDLGPVNLVGQGATYNVSRYCIL